MLCSMSTGKSGSNWLDRLRSSKGFPVGHDLNLEQFLNHHNPNLSNSSSDTKFADSTTNNIDPNCNTNSAQAENIVLDQKQTTEIPRENGETKWFGIMSNVLSELFNMGDSNDFPRRKSSRKQPNPKICVVSTSPNVVEHIQTEIAPSPSSDDNSIKLNSEEMKLTAQELDVNGGALNCEVEEDTCYADDLSAFSRTEVTVIDTSCRSWKFEKMLFRRKNVWKVRDKKCKAINFGRKKRKASLLSEDNFGNDEKKQKLSVVPLNEGLDHTDRVEEACKEVPDKFCQIPKMRFPRKKKKGVSSVILIKSIPKSKKNGRSNPLPKSFLKPTQRQYKS